MWVSDSYENIERQARAHMNRGDYQEALAGYHRLAQRLNTLKPAVLERRPELSRLHVLCQAQQATILHWQGELEQALDLYKELTEKDPANRDLWHQAMGMVMIDMGQTEAGLDELRARAVASPGDAIAWLTIAQECEALGRHDEAEENFERAMNNATTPEAKNEVFLAVFDYHRAQGQVDEAMEAWNKAWQDRDSHPDYIFPIYQMMWENGDFDSAREYLNKERNPLRKGFYRGWFAFEQQDLETAHSQWRKVAKMAPLKYEEGHDAWAEAALRSDISSQEIISVLQAVQQAGAMTIRGLILLAVAEARHGHVDHALSVLAAAQNIGLRSRPRQEKLVLSSWQLVDDLLSDEAAKNQMRPFFETEETEES